ncbi:apolipoprotein N-acyltransferase [Maribius pontilimi]|uniref:Apolipoprotein N-acyltransferase n=1 Tax=Palleronia pontilimi TaxID=1964209 RepID=A0A934MC33_9RHOB|nr:apolipoprotein N-acyltransferase [Palleronia pontilimi]MBJ3762348.1 apolipoprotein N-acyltransferase [Palleronia pontilimi]
MSTRAEPRGRFALCLAAFGGGLAGLGQAPVSIVPVALLGLAFAAWLCRTAPSARAAAWRGFWAGTGYFAVTLHWIVEPFLVDVARHGWMAPFALVFMATGFALFWALAFWVARRMGRGWRFAVGFGLSIAAVELVRSYVLTGFPWALLGYVWTENPGAWLAAWIGPHGLTLLTALLVGGLALAARIWVMALGAVAVWGGVTLAGLVLPEGDALARIGDDPVVRLVQPNARQDQKWDPDFALAFFDRQLDFTRAGDAPDLVIWPETAIPYLLQEGHPALDRIASAARGVPVILGAQRVDGLRAFNSLVVLQPDGRIGALYDKHHLVPFGEYMPFGQVTRLIGLRSFAARDGYGYSAGPGPRVLELGELGRVLPLICYEAIFPQDVSVPGSRPDWLLQITNDAWFGTFAGPQQHLAQARMRAIEQGLPMIRVANTGISAVIDRRGRVLEQLGLGQAGYFDTGIPAAGPMTPYAFTGDWPVAALVLLGLAGLGAAAGRGVRQGA